MNDEEFVEFPLLMKKSDFEVLKQQIAGAREDKEVTITIPSQGLEKLRRFFRREDI